MNGKTHQNSKAGLGWNSSDGRQSLFEPSKKGRKRKGKRAVKKEKHRGDGGGRLQPPFRAQE
jgi:hypothetical protein